MPNRSLRPENIEKAVQDLAVGVKIRIPIKCVIALFLENLIPLIHCVNHVPSLRSLRKTSGRPADRPLDNGRGGRGQRGLGGRTPHSGRVEGPLTGIWTTSTATSRVNDAGVHTSVVKAAVICETSESLAPRKAGPPGPGPFQPNDWRGTWESLTRAMMQRTAHDVDSLYEQ